MKDKLRLDLNDIYSKFGFSDGDILVDFFDSYPSSEKRCEDLYKLINHLIADKVKVELIISCHNPVRVVNMEDKKTLDVVELTKEEVLNILK